MGVVAAQLGITGIVPNTTGLGKNLAQQVPTFILLETNNTLAEVTVTGYLNASARTFGIPYTNHQIALVYTTDQGSVWLQIAVTGTAPNYVYSLIGTTDVASVFIASAGSAAAPSYTFTGDLDTGMYSSGANAVDFSTGGTKRAEITSAGLAVTGAISATTTVTAGTGVIATTGAVTAVAGALVSGTLAGVTAGSLVLYSATATNGSLRMLTVGNAGNFATTISDSASVSGQSQVITIPPSGAATANFLLDTGAANILAEQQFAGLSNVLAYSAGTWTVTRVAQGNYAAVHTPADDTGIIGIDVTPIIRVAAAKGFRLDSFDVIYSIGTLAMDAHSVTLDRIAYANNVAVSITSIGLTGTLATATQAQPYASNIAVATPAFDVTADSKYVIEVTANNAATTDYSFYGIMLKFSQTIA